MSVCAVRVIDIEWDSVLASITDERVDGQLSQQGDVLFLCFFLCAIGGEDGGALATMGTFKKAHVLHDAKNGDGQASEGEDGFARVQQSHFLRGGDNDDTIGLCLLCQCEGGVSRSWGQIHNEKISLLPGDFCEERCHGTDDHGAAPDEGGVFF